MFTLAADFKDDWLGGSHQNRVLHYFILLEGHSFALMPFVYCNSVHKQFGKMKNMLDKILRSCVWSRRPRSCTIVSMTRSNFFHACLPMRYLVIACIYINFLSPQKWAFMFMLQVGWALLSIVFTIFKSKRWTPLRLYEYYVGKGRFLLFLSESYRYSHTENDTISATNAIMGLTTFASTLSMNLHFAAIASMFGVSALTIWEMTANFVRTVEKGKLSRRLPIHQLCEDYRELVDTIQAINSTWSGLFLWLILETAAWMTTDLDGILKTSSHIKIIYQVFAVTTFMIGMVLSAECQRKVRKN